MTANKSVTANFGYPLSVVKAGIGLYILKNCLLKSKISNCPTQRAPDLRQSTPEPWWWDCCHKDSVRVFKHFAWLEVGSGKVALSRPTWLSSLSRHTSG
jgi:hypothetical protein